MKLFPKTVPLLPSLLVCSGLACDARAPDKPTVNASIPVALDEPSAPTFGPGIPIVVGMSPLSVAVHGAVAHAVGMGTLSTVQVGTLDELSHIETSGGAWDVATLGDEVFVADGRSGLASYKIDAAGRPKRMDQWKVPGECKRVVASERGIALLCAPRTLVLARPGHAREFITLPGEPNDAAWIGHSLYMACPGDGLLRLDADKMGPPVTYHQEKLDRVLSVVALGSRLFVGLRDKRVLELDPATAKIIAEITVLNRPMRLIAGENQLLVGSTWLGDTGATWVDASIPGQLRASGRLSFSIATGAYLGDTRWMVVRPEGGLSVVTRDGVWGEGRRRRPEAPNVQDGVWGEGRRRRPEAPNVQDGHIVAENHGVRFDRLAWGSSRNISWVEDRAALWTWTGDPPDISHTARKLADATMCGQGLCTVESTGRVCHLPAEGQQPVCIDISQGGTSLAWQASTQILWVIDTTGGLHGFALDSGLQEVATIARPSTAGAQNWGRFVIDGDRGVAIDVDFGILQVFDLGKPPRVRGRFLLHSLPKAVTLANDIAFVAEPRAGLQVVSIAQPDAPREVAFQVLDTGPFGVAARRDEQDRTVVVLASGERGISVWSWYGERNKLEMVRRSDTRGFAADVSFHGSQAYVADGASVLRFAWSELAP
jgi:hypothetical protein